MKRLQTVIMGCFYGNGVCSLPCGGLSNYMEALEEVLLKSHIGRRLGWMNGSKVCLDFSRSQGFRLVQSNPNKPLYFTKDKIVALPS